MPFFQNTGSAFRRSTSHVFRRYGGVTEVREVCDKAAQVAVLAFPMRLVPSIVSGEAAHPACYLLTDAVSLYIGETNNIGRRLGEHGTDPLKAFACEIFVVHGVKGFRFGKDAALYLQYRLTEAAEQAGLMTVLKGSPPRLPDIDPLDEPAYAAMFEDAQRLLFDAGLRAFASNCGKPGSANPAEIAPEPADDPEDAGKMEIGVHLPRAGVAEFELLYDDTIWARGYPAGDRFVVAAGSDYRVMTNPSSSPINCTRRQVLRAAGVLTPIPGAEDRMRLTVDVAFASAAIAAKIVCGAHVDSSKWRAIDLAQRPVMTL